MMSGFELKDISNSLDDLFLLSELCIMLLPHQYTIQNSDLHDQSTTIHENILCFLEKLNYKLVSIDNERRIIVEKNPATTQAVALVDDTTAISLIEYNHYALKGNLVKKRQILTSLGAFIEPILKSHILNNSGYKQLESDVGFMLNNFHVRHNNKEGAKAQEYIVSLNEAQLEEWYDKLYNAILSVIIINEHIPTQNHIATLKTTHKWKA